VLKDHTLQDGSTIYTSGLYMHHVIIIDCKQLAHSSVYFLSFSKERCEQNNQINQQNSPGLPATSGGLLAVQSPDVADSPRVLLHSITMKTPEYKSDYL
jgi:hypothetical protein